MILHIVCLSPFLKQYINLIRQNFEKDRHVFAIVDKKRKGIAFEEDKNIKWFESKLKFFSLLSLIIRAEKIILHGAGAKNVARILSLSKKFIEKTYWVMWGADFYFPETQPEWRKSFLSKIKHCITFIEGDFEYAIKNYNMSARMYECVMYGSSYETETNLDEKEIEKFLTNKNKTIKILAGNSAAKTNNHFEIYQKLSKFSDENIEIISILSYGADENYVNETISYGKRIFKDKFKPILNFMNFNDYVEFLKNMDIGIFATDRQQALGNIGILLKFGKKVYLKSNAFHYKFFKQKGMEVFEFEKITEMNFEDFCSLKVDVAINNKRVFENYFSIENCVNQWRKIFEN